MTIFIWKLGYKYRNAVFWLNEEMTVYSSLKMTQMAESLYMKAGYLQRSAEIPWLLINGWQLWPTAALAGCVGIAKYRCGVKRLSWKLGYYSYPYIRREINGWLAILGVSAMARLKYQWSLNLHSGWKAAAELAGVKATAMQWNNIIDSALCLVKMAENAYEENAAESPERNAACGTACIYRRRLSKMQRESREDSAWRLAWRLCGWWNCRLAKQKEKYSASKLARPARNSYRDQKTGCLWRKWNTIWLWLASWQLSENQAATNA